MATTILTILTDAELDERTRRLADSDPPCVNCGNRACGGEPRPPCGCAYCYICLGRNRDRGCCEDFGERAVVTALHYRAEAEKWRKLAKRMARVALLFQRAVLQGEDMTPEQFDAAMREEEPT